ncbi:hypothetical protein [Nocardia sp. NPDC052566]|uniref:hypothetical protein n=1 Tax=Nocardia sp. NPDC052566 TaxID=3364330 RepID=UPI0037C7C8B1
MPLTYTQARLLDAMIGPEGVCTATDLARRTDRDITAVTTALEWLCENKLVRPTTAWAPTDLAKAILQAQPNLYTLPQQRMLTELQKCDRPRTPDELAQHFGLPAHAIRNTANTLCRRGHLEPVAAHEPTSFGITALRIHHETHRVHTRASRPSPN